MKHESMNCITDELIIIASLIICIAQSAFGAEPVIRANSYWLPLTHDGLHEPKDPALHLMQNPAKTLSVLPPAGAGDQVDWVKALDKKYINPSISLRSNTQEEILDLNILFSNTGEMDMVDFPHKQHTEWLICSNCHEQIFKYKARATKFGMYDILNGEYCGRCHGTVAFPLTECKRCHNVPRASTAATVKQVE
jgi:c(7)-type cytochrome triheme protein